MDDVWAVDEVSASSVSGEDASMPKHWMDSIDLVWKEVGVEINTKKNVDRGQAEIQGVTLEPRTHLLGASVERRVRLMASAFLFSGRRWGSVKQLEVLLGRFGFVHGFQPCLRSIFMDCYSWIATRKSEGRRGGLLPQSVRDEVLLAGLLLPHASCSLDAPWCPRLECFDAAPGGHGRAWSTFDTEVVAEVARWADSKSARTYLFPGPGIEENAHGRCPLFRVRLPEASWWTEAARKGGRRHITLEEADAGIWSLEARLRRPTEVGSKVVEGGDNAAQIGAFSRGRSSSRRLNGRCRKACAVTLGGGLVPFWFWVSTTRNPADRPSRVFGKDDFCDERRQPKPAAEVPVGVSVFSQRGCFLSSLLRPG